MKRRPDADRMRRGSQRDRLTRGGEQVWPPTSDQPDQADEDDDHRDDAGGEQER